MRFLTVIAVVSSVYLTTIKASPVSGFILPREIEDSPGYPTQPWKRSITGNDPAPPWRRDVAVVELRSPKSTDTDAPPWRRGSPTESWRRTEEGGPGYPTNDWRREEVRAS